MKRYRTLASVLLLLSIVACSSDKKNYGATGTFEATEVTISANASGELLRLDLTEGQDVQAGQVLGLVDTTQLHLKKLQLLSSAQQDALTSGNRSLTNEVSTLGVQIQQVNDQIQKSIITAPKRYRPDEVCGGR